MIVLAASRETHQRFTTLYHIGERGKPRGDFPKRLVLPVAHIDCIGNNTHFPEREAGIIPLTQREGLQREVRDFEPHVALFGGPTGFELYDRIVSDAPRVLRAGGWLILELGFTSLEHVRGLLAGWNDVRVIPDLAGIPRVIAAQAP